MSHHPQTTPATDHESTAKPPEGTVQRVSSPVQRGLAPGAPEDAAQGGIARLRRNWGLAAPRTFVRMFQPRFAALVEAGTKQQTIRPRPKRMPHPGDYLSARTWTGRPYRSRQRILREAVISSVNRISIYDRHFWLQQHEPLLGVTITNPSSLDIFAQNDGFSDWSELVDWFSGTHSLPFTGICIFWMVAGGADRMNTPVSVPVLVTVRGTGPHVARCCGKTCSCEMDAHYAAAGAAAKHFRVPYSQIHLRAEGTAFWALPHPAEGFKTAHQISDEHFHARGYDRR